MKCQTKTGLKLILIGLGFGIILNIALFLSSFIMPNDLIAGIGFLMIIGLIGIIMAIILLIGSILFLMGRTEFGEKHSKNVLNAVIIFVISIVVVGVISGIGSVINTMGETSGQVPNLYMSSFIPSVISAILGGLVYYFALKELEDETGLRIMYIAFICSIITTIFIGFVTVGVFGDIFGEIYSGTSTSSPDLSTVMSSISGLTRVSIFSNISGFLWLIAVYIPYRRIDSGELIPQPAKPLFDSSSTRSERICPNCNKDIPMDANNCPYCGKQFETYL